jgi:hypothetical protein
MSKPPLARPIPVGVLVTDRSRKFSRTAENPAPILPVMTNPSRVTAPAFRSRSAVMWMGVGLLGLTGVALNAVALRPVKQSVIESAHRPASDPPPVAEQVPAVPIVEVATAPDPVEPGEARPFNGFRPSAPEELPPTIVASPEPIKAGLSKGPRCDRFGTAIDFLRSPTLAFDRSAREQKLVMVLHLAGNFEDPGFT